MSNLQNVQTFKNIPQEEQALVISKLVQPIIRYILVFFSVTVLMSVHRPIQYILVFFLWQS